MGGEHTDKPEQLEPIAELLGLCRSTEARCRRLEAALAAVLEAVPFPIRNKIRKALDDG